MSGLRRTKFYYSMVKSTSIVVLLMITEEEISHKNNNFFDLSHPNNMCTDVEVESHAKDCSIQDEGGPLTIKENDRCVFTLSLFIIYA